MVQQQEQQFLNTWTSTKFHSQDQQRYSRDTCSGSFPDIPQNGVKSVQSINLFECRRNNTSAIIDSKIPKTMLFMYAQPNILFFLKFKLFKLTKEYAPAIEQ